MINILVTEIDLNTPNFDHVQYLRFDLDNGKPFCYRSRMSYNAFAYGARKGKKSPCWKKNDKLYYCNHEVNCIKFRKFDPLLSLVDLKSLWEFYQHIGYDYKTKKWTDE
jgi:hypothetical protein